jgi:hypothetical protein
LGAAYLIDQPEERKSVIFEALLLLTARMEQKASDFQLIITGDELWFLLCHPHDSAWAASCDEGDDDHLIIWQTRIRSPLILSNEIQTTTLSD